MTIPRKTVRINGRRWRIAVVDKISDADEYGLCDHADRRIVLKRGPLHQLQDTLFHEITHAACPSLTEDVVAEVERGLYGVLNEHPWLREWLFRSGKT